MIKMGNKPYFKAIIAEKEGIEAAYLRLLLEKNGWKAEVVHSPFDLIRKMEKDGGDYSLVLMDREFCQNDGLSAPIKIKNMEQAVNHSITVVGVTSYTLAEEKKKLMAAGVDYCLTKPVYNDSIVSMLQNIMTAVLSSSTPTVLSA